ncbi:hypothetical protein FMEAI12_3350026 [Parafrankia sp. Ea1.12]|nr:hypothetical protein FMEAI12_3350026 [Parafrankia sp. Ea1.12]
MDSQTTADATTTSRPYLPSLPDRLLAGPHAPSLAITTHSDITAETIVRHGTANAATVLLRSYGLVVSLVMVDCVGVGSVMSL